MPRLKTLWECKTLLGCPLLLPELCVAWCTYIVCAVRAQAPASKDFHNRSHELDCLKRLLSSPPNSAGITIIVGPPSCGKTALVKQYLKTLKEPKPLYIDCRMEAVSTPDSFATALLSTTVSAGEQFKQVVARIVGAALSGLSDTHKLGNQTEEVKLSSVMGLIGGPEAMRSRTPLASVLHLFKEVLKQTSKEGRPGPPIIIDEANRLTSWSTAHPDELAMLLCFFVAITKQENMAHVVLMTSDYAFISWLEEGERTIFLRLCRSSQVLRNLALVMTLYGLVCRGRQNLFQSIYHRPFPTGRSARILQHTAQRCNQQRRLAARF